MQEIQSAQQEDEEQVSGEKAEHDGQGLPEDTDVEHVVNDDDAELQALGAAQEQDEVRKLGDLGIEDEDEALGAKPRGQDVNEQEDRSSESRSLFPISPSKTSARTPLMVSRRRSCLPISSRPLRR